MAKKTLILILLCLFAWMDNIHSQPVTAQIDSLMLYVHNKYGFSGVVLTAENSDVLYKKAFGFANRKSNLPLTTENVFLLGSMSKQFTGYIILDLIDEEKLSFSDPLSKFLPGFNDTIFGNVKINNLLTHTSGLVDYSSMQGFDEKKKYDYNTIIDMIASKPLMFPPGTAYKYSNSNYFLLAQIAMRVTGKSFDSLLAEYITTPAGMKNTGEFHSTSLPSLLSGSQVNENGSYNEPDALEMENTIGGGGLYSTAGDLLKWSLFLQSKLTRVPILANSLRLNALCDSSISIYSSGWCLLNGEIMHEGHISGFANHISIFPDNKRTVIILSNSDFKELYFTSRILLKIMNGSEEAFSWMGSKLTPKQINGYPGAYIHNSDTVILKIDNHKLISSFQRKEIPWAHGPEDSFYNELFEGNIWFVRNEESEITGVALFSDYHITRWKKVR